MSKALEAREFDPCLCLLALPAPLPPEMEQNSPCSVNQSHNEFKSSFDVGGDSTADGRNPFRTT